MQYLSSHYSGGDWQIVVILASCFKFCSLSNFCNMVQKPSMKNVCIQLNFPFGCFSQDSKAISKNNSRRKHQGPFLRCCRFPVVLDQAIDIWFEAGLWVSHVKIPRNMAKTQAFRPRALRTSMKQNKVNLRKSSHYLPDYFPFLSSEISYSTFMLSICVSHN